MKSILASLALILLLPIVSLASSPYLVTASNSANVGAIFEIWTNATPNLTDAATITAGTLVGTAPAQSDGSLSLSLSSLAAGTYNFYVRAYNDYGVWGKSAYTPFVSLSTVKPVMTTPSNITGLSVVAK